REWEARCNDILSRQIDIYLQRLGASKNDFIEAALSVLRGRRIPTQQEVADRLSLSGRRIPKTDVGILLDLLGHVGVLQTAQSRAYFPWVATRRQVSAGK